VSLHQLPALNACLNFASATFLLLGFLAIKSRRIQTHRLFMLLAFGSSSVFLSCYLYYHFHVGHVPFRGTGGLRTLYFMILLSHTLLALATVPLALMTLSRALRGRFDLHKRIARITLPVWGYVSVTGVIVYWMLYRL
jgi:putative membrane protein